MEDVSITYVKRMNVMVYQLVTNYLSAIVNTPQFNFNAFLVSL